MLVLQCTCVPDTENIGYILPAFPSRLSGLCGGNAVTYNRSGTQGNRHNGTNTLAQNSGLVIPALFFLAFEKWKRNNCGNRIKASGIPEMYSQLSAQPMTEGNMRLVFQLVYELLNQTFFRKIIGTAAGFNVEPAIEDFFNPVARTSMELVLR